MLAASGCVDGCWDECEDRGNWGPGGRRGWVEGGDEGFVGKEIGYEVLLESLCMGELSYTWEVDVPEDGGRGH